MVELEDLVLRRVSWKKKTLVRLVNGRIEGYPLARAEVKTPYFTGVVQAICPESPLYDFIIGNTPGATELKEPPEMQGSGGDQSCRQDQVFSMKVDSFHMKKDLSLNAKHTKA